MPAVEQIALRLDRTRVPVDVVAAPFRLGGEGCMRNTNFPASASASASRPSHASFSGTVA